MGTTEMRKNGADLNRLNDKMRHFALEYSVSHNGTDAAKRAGYSKKTAGVMAVRILKHPVIKAFLGKIERESQEKFEIERNDILRNLAACATRDGKDFVDDDGRLLLTSQNIKDLPSSITCAIDGIKQKRKTYRMEDGTEVEELETELKLVSKASALDMCMKHKGLFAAEKKEEVIRLDWDSIFAGGNTITVDPTQERLQEEKTKLLGDKE